MADFGQTDFGQPSLASPFWFRLCWGFTRQPENSKRHIWGPNTTKIPRGRGKKSAKFWPPTHPSNNHFLGPWGASLLHSPMTTQHTQTLQNKNLYEASPKGDSKGNGEVERVVQSVHGLVRTLKAFLKRSPLLVWLVEHCSNLLLPFHKGEPHDGHNSLHAFEGQGLES